MSIALLSLLGGVLYRLRGGAVSALVGHDLGTQAARLCWALPTGVLIGFLSGVWWLGVLSAVGALVGLLISHGRYFAPGFDNYVGMTLITAARVLLIVLAPAIFVDPILCLALVAALFPAYQVGWYLPSLPQLTRGTEWAEFLTGAAIWGAISFVWPA